MAAILCAVATVTLGPHIAHGGFYSDDWGVAADYRYAHPPRILSLADSLEAGLGARYLSVFALAGEHAVFGLHMSAHLALAAGLSVLATVCFFLLLRSAGLELVHAAVLAVLALVFPWADSVRLWSAEAANDLAACLYFLGAAVAVRGLRSSGRRGALIHGCAQVMYLLSVFTYEAALPAILLSMLLYLPLAPSWRIALRRWCADLLVGGLALVAIALLTQRQAPSVRALASDLVHLVGTGMALLGHATFPVGLPHVAAAVALVLLVLLVIRVWRGAKSDGQSEAEIRRWLGVGALAAAFTFVAYAMFLGSGLHPLSSGTENRGNLLATYGHVTLAYSLLMIVALLARRGRLGLSSPALGLGIGLALAVGYSLQLENDVRRWDRATGEQRHVLATVRAAIAAPSSGTTLYTFAAPGRVAPGVPIFTEAWDLRGAVRLMYHDDHLSAYPVYGEAKIVCGASMLYPEWHGDAQGPDGGFGPAQGAPYGRAVFLDLGSRRIFVVRSREACQAASRRFAPGPLFADST